MINLFSKTKRILFRVFRKTLHIKKNNICNTAIINNSDLVKLKPTSEIQDYVIIRISENPLTLGEHSQINPFCVIYGNSGVYIGDNVMIAPHCTIAAGNHNHKQIEIPMRHIKGYSTAPIIIEDDVWIGANCTITDGVKISKGAVIGANSVVTKNVNSYDIVAGCPAKIIGNRTHLYGGNTKHN